LAINRQHGDPWVSIIASLFYNFPNYIFTIVSIKFILICRSFSPISSLYFFFPLVFGWDVKIFNKHLILIFSTMWLLLIEIRHHRQRLMLLWSLFMGRNAHSEERDGVFFVYETLDLRAAHMCNIWRLFWKFWNANEGKPRYWMMILYCIPVTGFNYQKEKRNMP
jgi:hypothetical protein